MENAQNFDHLVNTLKKLKRLSEKELGRIEPVIRRAMASGIQDMNYLESITEPLHDLVFSGVGEGLYAEYPDYVESLIL